MGLQVHRDFGSPFAKCDLEIRLTLALKHCQHRFCDVVFSSRVTAAEDVFWTMQRALLSHFLWLACTPACLRFPLHVQTSTGEFAKDRLGALHQCAGASRLPIRFTMRMPCTCYPWTFHVSLGFRSDDYAQEERLKTSWSIQITSGLYPSSQTLSILSGPY